MASIVSKTGIAAVTKAIERICIVVRRYGPKLQSVINAGVSSGVITASEAATALSFINLAVTACTIFQKLSGY